MEPPALALPAAFRQRIESLELIIDFCLGEIEADEEGGGPAMESQGTGAGGGRRGEREKREREEEEKEREGGSDSR